MGDKAQGSKGVSFSYKQSEQQWKKATFCNKKVKTTRFSWGGASREFGGGAEEVRAREFGTERRIAERRPVEACRRADPCPAK